MGWLSKIIPDRFIWVLIGAIALANIWPAQGSNVQLANLATGGAVFLIFLLHGIRLPRAEVIAGLHNWRLQGAIALFVFFGMALTGLLLGKLFALWLPPVVALGLLYCGVVPSRAIGHNLYPPCPWQCRRRCGCRRDNQSGRHHCDAGAVRTVGGAGGRGGGGGGGGVGGGCIILLVPFIIGQVLQRWLRPWAMRHPAVIRVMDQGAIAVAVYVAFSAAIVGGHLVTLSGGEFALVGLAVAAMLLAGFGGAWLLGGAMRLPLADRTTMLFAGGHKSIAVGAPLATLLFPASSAGMILLPLLIYHLAQLLISAWIAPALAARMPTS